MLVDRNAGDDRVRAKKLLDESLPIYEDIGMPRHIELARKGLAAI